MNFDNEQPRVRPQDLKNAKDVVCESCGHNVFTPGFYIKVLSALASPTGREVHLPVQTFACAKCNTVNKDFVPNFNS